MGMNERLAQTLFGVTFVNPVLAASGTFGWGSSYRDFYDIGRLGGFVTKSVTPEPRRGNPPPRIIETPSGMLNAIGLQNDGLDHFMTDIEPTLRDIGTNVIVSVACRTLDDYLRVCERLVDCSTIAALEINISCPNVKEGGVAFGSTPESAAASPRPPRRPCGRRGAWESGAAAGSVCFRWSGTVEPTPGASTSMDITERLQPM